MIYVASTLDTGPKDKAYIGVFESKEDLNNFSTQQKGRVGFSEHESLKSANEFMNEMIETTPWYKNWNDSKIEK